MSIAAGWSRNYWTILITERLARCDVVTKRSLTHLNVFSANRDTFDEAAHIVHIPCINFIDFYLTFARWLSGRLLAVVARRAAAAGRAEAGQLVVGGGDIG